MPKQQIPADQAHFSFTLDAVIDLNGEDPDYIGKLMNSAFGRAIGAGALTGHSESTVDAFSCGTTVLTPEAAALDENQVAEWLSQQIESGSMPLEELPRLMARYALAKPAAMREEIAERMEQTAEVPANSFPDVQRGSR